MIYSPFYKRGVDTINSINSEYLGYFTYDNEKPIKNEFRKKLDISKVIFNNPATIVFWNDGTKTVVKRQKGDRYDKEKGLMAAIIKKQLGNKGNYYNEIKKWLED